MMILGIINKKSREKLNKEIKNKMIKRFSKMRG